MRKLNYWHARPIAVLAVVVFSSVHLAYSAEPKAAAAVESARPSAKSETVAAPPQATTSQAEKPSLDAPKKKAEKLRFQFRFQPWKDVLDWFAQQADLSLVANETPPGTFNYSDTREYTPAEAIDLLNSVLLTKGYTLVRRDRMLMLVNIEDGIPNNLVSTVPVESLDGRGEFELVNVLFNLNKVRPEDIEAEIQKLLGPQGSVKSLAKSQQLSVTDTTGRLRAVRDYLKRIEGPEGTVSSGLKTFHLKIARSEDVMPILRQMLEIPEDKSAATDGSIRVAQEAGGNRLIVSGRPDKVARASEIIEGLDVPASGADVLSGTPQLEVYPLNGCDGSSALLVLQSVLAGQSDVHLSADPKTGNLVALARPAQQATIRATLKQLQLGAQRVEVIRLTRVDPQSALISINKLFSSGDPKQPSTTAPQVDADSVNHQLLIRGTEAQIVQIRDLLTKLGEHLDPGDVSQGGHVRTLPMSEGAARSALQRIEEIWPTMRANKIHIVSPSAGSGSTPATGGGAELRPELFVPPRAASRSSESKKSKNITRERDEYKPAPPLLDLRPADPLRSPEEKPQQKPQESPQTAPAGKVTMTSQERPGKLFGARIFFVADGLPAKALGEAKPPAPIIVIPGPSGLTIASEDLEALDEFERLLTTAAEGSANGPMAVFYLKYAKAEAVAAELDRLLAGGVSESGSSSDKSSDASRLSASRGALATGPIKITPETRLNALIVLANRTDQNTIERLLKILDLKESPEDIAVSPKPRMIPVEHARAKDIADVLRQIYADRMVVAPQDQQQGRGGFLRAMMGGMGPGGFGGPGGGFGGPGGGQGGQNQRDNANRISIGVDARTNNLIVSATDTLFEEVKQLVQQLDEAAASQNETVRVVTLHRTSAAAVEKALTAFAGDAVQSSSTSTTNAASGNNNANASSQPWWANRGFGGGSPGGQPSMGGGGPFGGNSSPFQGGFGRRSQFFQPGGPGR